MGFFDWIKASNENLKRVESQIYEHKKDYLEVYQRNQALEREIAQRTEELHKANQTLLTLEHVWDMMNSSRPLSNVLETIVSSLHGEFGYLYSCIVQKQLDKDGVFYSLRTYLKNEFSQRLENFLGKSIFDVKLKIKKNGKIQEAIENKTAVHYTDLYEILTEVFPDLDDNEAQEIVKKTFTKSVIILPLVASKEFTGFLAVFSPRSEAKDDELNFLNLFARQIELAITIANLFETVKKQAVTDPLTELFNRRFFDDAIEREANRALRLNQPFTLIGLDLDHLKQINDTYGHSMGDRAISTVARVILRNARSVDIASRIGGEEFSIILPGIDAKGGMIAAERLRASIEKEPVEGLGNVTASIGVATFIEHTLDLDDLIEMSDKAMYDAKEQGRNRVCLAQPQKNISWQDVAVNAFVEILEKHRIPFNNKLALELSNKLQTRQENVKGNSAQELLYSVVDTISQSYTASNQDGITKAKMSLATLVAKKFKLSKTEIDKLKIAILLYDIGNTMLPDEILKKPAPLTKEEKDKVVEHPLLAAREILKPITNISDIIPIIEHHHENWDGSGYPNQIKGEKIPITSQIILIVDSYFAMISDRPYRRAYTQEEAIEEIKRQAGKKYSEELTDEFIAALDEFYNIT